MTMARYILPLAAGIAAFAGYRLLSDTDELLEFQAADISPRASAPVVSTTPVKVPESRPTSNDPIPAKVLALVLRGTLATGEPATSRAFIAHDATSSAYRYAVGDELPGQAVLHSVDNDSVEVRVGEQIVTLGFGAWNSEAKAVLSTSGPSGAVSPSTAYQLSYGIWDGDEDYVSAGTTEVTVPPAYRIPEPDPFTSPRQREQAEKLRQED